MDWFARPHKTPSLMRTALDEVHDVPSGFIESLPALSLKKSDDAPHDFIQVLA